MPFYHLTSFQYFPNTIFLMRLLSNKKIWLFYGMSLVRTGSVVIPLQIYHWIEIEILSKTESKSNLYHIFASISQIQLIDTDFLNSLT